MGATILKQVQNQLEAFSTLIIWIGDGIAAHSLAHKRSHPYDFVFRLNRRSQLLQVGEIAVIHTYNKVKIIKIGATHLTADVRQLITPPTRMHTHTLVGQVADMPSAHPRGVDFKPPIQAAGLHNCAHHPLGCRAAAYIPETHKKDAYFLLTLQPRNQFLNFVI